MATFDPNTMRSVRNGFDFGLTVQVTPPKPDEHQTLAVLNIGPVTVWSGLVNWDESGDDFTSTVLQGKFNASVAALTSWLSKW